MASNEPGLERAPPVPQQRPIGHLFGPLTPDAPFVDGDLGACRQSVIDHVLNVVTTGPDQTADLHSRELAPRHPSSDGGREHDIGSRRLR